MEEIKNRKRKIRKEVNAIKKCCSAHWKAKASERLLRQIEEREDFRSAGTVLLYYALPDEVQTEAFIQKWSRTKTIVLPLVQGSDLLLKRYDGKKIVEGYRSIKEPDVSCQDIPAEAIDLAIIPGVAFDSKGNRLGRGKGFYDRILPSLKCPKIGVGFYFQYFEDIPTEPFDMPLDEVLTTRAYDHFIFDIDGTLIDTEKTAMTSLQMTVEEILGKHMDTAELSIYFGIPSAQTVIELGFPDPEKALHTWERHYQDIIYLSKPYPGVQEALSSIAGKGYRIGTVTSRSRFEYNHDPNMTPLRPFFNISVCKEDTDTHKPTPGPMLAYLEKSGADPAASLYIGDTVYDCQCANGAGVDFALIDWKDREEGEDPYRDIDCDFLVHNTDELKKLILG